MNHRTLDRRAFLGMMTAAGFAFLANPRRASANSDVMDRYFLDNMAESHIPGLALAVMKNRKLVWSKGYGWANLEQRIPMTPDTILNIGSVSKTFTSTALMQLWEAKKFQLEDDINSYLTFEVRHPVYPSRKISFRSLLTHTSSIDDGPSYPRAYACGDPAMSLQDWLQAYLTPQGTYYDEALNFHDWAPGGGFAYCNVGYGLLGHLVETLSGLPFAEYCRFNIFEKLGMEETSWYLKDIDTSRHAIPYSWISNGVIRGPSWGGIPVGVVGQPRAAAKIKQGYAANCLYNHPNYPDGFLRTSVRQLGHYIEAYLNEGQYKDVTLLQADTIKSMFEVQTRDTRRVMGLTWNAPNKPGEALLWGHGGSDPGINANVRLRFSDGAASIVLMNTNFTHDAATPKPLEFAQYLVAKSPGM